MKIKFINRASDISPPHLLESQLLISFLKHKIIIMKKTILLFLITSIFYNHADSQITKGNWLVGGNASFSFSNSNVETNDVKTTTISVNPDIGYFFIDKFAGGLRLSFYNNHIKSGPPYNNFFTFANYSIGPFVRYYFLPVDNPYNIITEGSYQFGGDKTTSNNPSGNYNSNNSFTFSAGPVIYFNTSVGIEFLLSYKSFGNSGSNTRGSLFGAEIGLQIHLQKDKN